VNLTLVPRTQSDLQQQDEPDQQQDEPDEQQDEPDEPDQQQDEPDEPDQQQDEPDEPDQQQDEPDQQQDEPDQQQDEPDEPDQQQDEPDEPDQQQEDQPLQQQDELDLTSSSTSSSPVVLKSLVVDLDEYHRFLDKKEHLDQQEKKLKDQETYVQKSENSLEIIQTGSGTEEDSTENLIIRRSQCDEIYDNLIKEFFNILIIRKISR